MSNEHNYVLGQSERAARRLELQDRHFAAASESLLDALQLKPTDRVVELGCGPGGLTKRIVKRLGSGGHVLAVDASEGFLEQAKAALQGVEAGKVDFLREDVSRPGAWLAGADVVIGRAVLHHIPMAEFLLGRLKAALPAGTRIGFLEPDFRRPLARLAHEEVARPELAPLLSFTRAINELYAAWRISPAVGASLAPAMQEAGYANVQHMWHPFDSDADVLENMGLIYEEVRETFGKLGIISSEEIDRQQKLLRALQVGNLPPAWGMHQVTASA